MNSTATSLSWAPAVVVPPDEHPWVERTGVTATYRQMRNAVRAAYRDGRPLIPAARSAAHLNPGRAWVSNLAADPTVVHGVLRGMLQPWVSQGQLRLLTRHQPISAEIRFDRVDAVVFTDTRDGGTVRASARYVLDATEEGDLLPLTGCEHVVGAESADETTSAHRRADASDRPTGGRTSPVSVLARRRDRRDRRSGSSAGPVRRSARRRGSRPARQPGPRRV
jgi:hypothetical protein